jgi:BlaI family penicillinase repressor
MARGKAPLTGQELEIMKVVWKLGPATVRQVYEALLKRRRIAYTTVMTMMNILEQKGHLRKRPDGKAYVYSAVKPEQQVLRAMVRDFVDRVFNGSAEPLLLHLVADDRLTAEELDQVRGMIEASREGRKPR